MGLRRTCLARRPPLPLVRVGTSGDAAAAEDLIWRWSLDADAIAISGIREARAAGHHSGRIEDLQHIKRTTTRVPVRDDSLLTDIFQEWAIRRVEAEMPGYFANARVVVVGGTARERTVAVLRCCANPPTTSSSTSPATTSHSPASSRPTR